eukprot:TRINITY_DN5276_c0_g1_i1.p1 TRINITY_DN5276_c0_g1~~TRINITY_DN5276_c0_g1_i1.p1  ORF type:complete len:936 (+),score=110.25 TRINITY_DN5276_c0_g1_i1:254-3061(+)
MWWIQSLQLHCALLTKERKLLTRMKGILQTATRFIQNYTRNTQQLDSTAKKKARVERSKLFLPPRDELEAVETYCDSLQKQAISNFVKKAKASHEKVLNNLREKVCKLSIKGTSSKWTEDHLQKLLLWIRDEAPIIIHVPFDADGRMEKFLKDTHYRNQFETKISRGTLDFSETGSRAGWEDRIFNKDYSKAVAHQRPKYGCLNIVNDPRGISSATSYGDSYIVLKGCRLRTSFADKDSSCTDAQIASCEYHAHVLNKYSDQELQRVLEVANRMRLWHKSDVVHNYKEVQIHGELRLAENIDLIVLHEKYKTNKKLVDNMDKFCEKNNCKYIFMPTYTDADKTSFTGDLWEMAGKDKPEGFLSEHKPLPPFLTTGSDDFAEPVVPPKPVDSPKPEKTKTIPPSDGEQNVVIRISKSSCKRGTTTGLNPSGLYQCTTCDGETMLCPPENLSWCTSFVGTKLKFCTADQVHAVPKGKHHFAPAIVHRIEKSGLVGVIFESDPKRLTVSISPKNVRITCADTETLKPVKPWSTGNRVLVEYDGMVCHPGVVKSVLLHSQYHVALDTGDVISSASHRMSDEPEVHSDDCSKPSALPKFSPGEAVHARYTHGTAHPAIIVKCCAKPNRYLVRFTRSEALPSPEEVHCSEIRKIGVPTHPTKGSVPKCEGGLVGSEMFMDWADLAEEDDTVKERILTDAYDDESEVYGAGLFDDDDDEEEEEKKKGEEKPVEKTCEASSDSSSLGFDLFGSDLDDEAAPDKPHIPADHWACPACTYYNADRRPKCEICDEDKPASAEKDESDEDACSDLSSGYLSETSISDLLPVSSSSPVSKIVGCTWTVDSKVSEKPRVVFTRVNTCFEGSGTEEKPTYMAVGELVVGRATGTAAEKPLEKLDALNEESLKIREKVLKELIEAAKVELAQTSEHLASKVKSTIREATHA